MTKKPLVSICIPVYNRRGMLLECLESARQQTWGNIEIIVGDNASTDGTAEAALEVAEHDRRITVLTSTENVVGLNYNRVVSAAKGEFIKILNSDDLLYPQAVERLVEAFDPGVTLSFGRADYITMTGEPATPRIFETWLDLEGSQQLPGREFGQQMLEMVCNLIGEPTFTLFRRRDLDDRSPTGYAGRTWRYLNDWGTWLHLLEQGDAAFVDEKLVAIRTHAARSQRQIGNDLVLAFDIEGLTYAVSQRGWAETPSRTKAQVAALRVFTHRSYMVTGSRGIVDQLEGVRVVTERLLGQDEPGPEQRGVQYLVGPVPLPGEDLVDALLHAWWQAFPSRTDIELILFANDADHERRCNSQIQQVRELRGFASTPVSVRRADLPRKFDRPVTMVRADITSDELGRLVPGERVAAPPWAPMLLSQWVQYDLR
jgi:glycosyltransferase involved in cell wall biosynthesis